MVFRVFIFFLLSNDGGYDAKNNDSLLGSSLRDDVLYGRRIREKSAWEELG